MLIVYKLNFIVGLTFNGILRLIGNEVCDKKRRMFIKTFYNYLPTQKVDYKYFSLCKKSHQHVCNITG